MIIRFLLAACALMCLSGCSGLSYYAQAAQGQWRLLSARQDVDDVLQTELTPEVRRGLQLSQQVLSFAEEQLGITGDGRYTTYVELPGRAVVWNVFASDADQVRAYTWCYPIVGCAPYRGYFSEARAQAYANQLDAEGWDTFVGAVPAYSTLGWFEDPLLSSFITWPEGDLVNLIVHELAHSRVWVASDVVFNENFASFVADQATRAWFLMYTEAGAQRLQAWLTSQRQWALLRGLLLRFKGELTETLADLEPVAAGLAKSQAYAALQRCYAEAREQLGGRRYDSLMSRLNNAYLVSLGTYADWQGAFAQIFAASDGSWSQFFAEVERLADLPAGERRAHMEALLAQQQEHAQADDDSAEQIHCQAFAGHGGDTEASG